MTFPSLQLLRNAVRSLCETLLLSLRQRTKPDHRALLPSVAANLTRSRRDLVLENALLCQQRIVLSRQVKRPTLTWRDRTTIVLLGRRLRTWKETLLIVQPDTVLRWHRDLFRRVWKHKSKPGKKPHRPRTAEAIVALIQQMDRENRDWGAERIHGELLKLGIEVGTTTIRKYVRLAHRPLSPKQSGATFLRNHAHQIWACDFLQTYDAFFRALFVFVIIELESRRVVYFAVTRNPSDPWGAQQLRNATPFGQAPRFLIRDNDCKYGASFARVAQGTHIEYFARLSGHQRPTPSASDSWGVYAGSAWTTSCSSTSAIFTASSRST